MVETVVYVDVLIFLNTIINYCLLSLTRRYCCLKTRRYRLIVTAFVSSFSSLLLFAPHFHSALLFLYKLLIAALTVMAAFFPQNIKVMLRLLTVLLMFSIIFCGLMIAVYQIWKPSNMAIVNDIVYFHIDPLLTIALTALIYAGSVLLGKLIAPADRETTVALTFTVKGTDYFCVGKIDTACSATEPFSGSPVIIAERSVFNVESLDGKRVIPFATLNGNSIMFGVKADKVCIDNQEIKKQIYIASAEKIGERFQAIINSEITR